jgi:hypothetical protein
MSDKNTTICGIAAIIVAIGSALTSFFDGDPTTAMDIGATIAAITAGVGLLLAKDASKKVA